MRVSDLEANKRTVVEFFDLAFNQKRVDEAIERCIGPTYTQHNPADRRRPRRSRGFRPWPATPNSLSSRPR